ncbi:unnamed protein product [Cochlearia groenlandica]
MYLEVNEASCKRNHVVFHNEVKPDVILDIKCYEAETGKIRAHKLEYKAKFYIIDFKDNLWPSPTIWYCNIALEPGRSTYYDDLVAYKSNFQRCGQLRSWSAREDGIWFTRKYGEPPGLVLAWKKG